MNLATLRPWTRTFYSLPVVFRLPSLWAVGTVTVLARQEASACRIYPRCPGCVSSHAEGRQAPGSAKSRYFINADLDMSTYPDQAKITLHVSNLKCVYVCVF